MTSGTLIAVLAALVVFLLFVGVLDVALWLSIVFGVIVLVIGMSTAGYEIGKKR